MDDEDSWNPPWDCDEDTDEQIDFGSPFRDPASHAFRFVPVNGHPDFKTAKKQLHFNEEGDVIGVASPSEDDTSVNSKIQEKQKRKIKSVKYWSNIDIKI